METCLNCGTETNSTIKQLELHKFIVFLKPKFGGNNNIYICKECGEKLFSKEAIFRLMFSNEIKM